MRTLSEIQKKYLNNCPECGLSMHAIDSPESMEVYLHCDNCDLSMDSSGGYIQ